MNEIKVVMDLDFAEDLLEDLNYIMNCWDGISDTVSDLMDVLRSKIEEVKNESTL